MAQIQLILVEPQPDSPPGMKRGAAMMVTTDCVAIQLMLSQKECESLSTGFKEMASKLASGIVTATSIPPAPGAPKKPM